MKKPKSTNETTERDLAKKLGISRQLVGRKRRQGKSDAEIAQEAETRRLTRNANARGETFAGAQTRTQRAVASLREVELALKQGEAVSIADVTQMLSSMISNCRAQLLGIPTKIGQELAGETSPTTCAEIVRTAIHEALHELASDRFTDLATSSTPLTGVDG